MFCIVLLKSTFFLTVDVFGSSSRCVCVLSEHTCSYCLSKATEMLRCRAVVVIPAESLCKQLYTPVKMLSNVNKEGA